METGLQCGPRRVKKWVIEGNYLHQTKSHWEQIQPLWTHAIRFNIAALHSKIPTTYHNTLLKKACSPTENHFTRAPWSGVFQPTQGVSLHVTTGRKSRPPSFSPSVCRRLKTPTEVKPQRSRTGLVAIGLRHIYPQCTAGCSINIFHSNHWGRSV